MGRMRVSGHGKVIHGQIIQAAPGRKLKVALFDGMLCIWFVWQGIMLHLVVWYMEPFPTFNPVISVSIPICGELPTNTFLETVFGFTPMGLFHSSFRFDAEIEVLIFIQTNSVVSVLKQTHTSPKLW